MADKSRIEWTDATWNPVYGCDKVSPGCAHCYAERTLPRVRGRGVPFNVITLNDTLVRMSEPARWTRPRKIFVCSLSDLFHPRIPVDFRDQIFVRMLLANHHLYQILTKRVHAAAEYLGGLLFRPSLVGAVLNLCYTTDQAPGLNQVLRSPLTPERPTSGAVERFWPLPRILIGVSVENDRYLGRLDALARMPAWGRFVSFEPLLGPIPGRAIASWMDQVIVGGESGFGCRLFEDAWALTIFQAAERLGVPRFMKQRGGWPDKRDAMADFPPELQVREEPRTEGKP